MTSNTNLEATAATKIIETATLFEQGKLNHAESAQTTWQSLDGGASALGIAKIVKAAVVAKEVKSSEYTYTSDPAVKTHGLTGYLLLTYSGKLGQVAEHVGGGQFKNIEGTSIHLQSVVRRSGVKLFWSTLEALPEGSKLRDAYLALEKAATAKERKAARAAKSDNTAETVESTEEDTTVVPIENLLASLESVLSALIVRQNELDTAGHGRVANLTAMISEIKIPSVPGQRVA